MTNTTTTTTTKQAATALRRAAKKHERDTLPEPVQAPAMSHGQLWAQGDVGILAVDHLPKGARACPAPTNGQVAPGTTQGSRHCVSARDGAVKFYRHGGDALSDLSLDASEPWTMTHPEHGHVTFPPGLYQIIHQQNEQRERVRD